MANISEKKRKLLVLLQIFWEKTDDFHTLTLPEILQELENRGIPAERKSIYDDIETLRSVGFSIETRKAKTFQYYLGEHVFSEEELALLIEAVSNAEFISSGRSAELEKKLLRLCSDEQGKRLSEIGFEKEPAMKERTGGKLVLEFSTDQKSAVEEFFGSDISAEPSGKNRFRATLRAELGPDFYGWLLLQGTAVRVVSPKKLAEQLRERAKAMAKLYKS